MKKLFISMLTLALVLSSCGDGSDDKKSDSSDDDTKKEKKREIKDSNQSNDSNSDAQAFCDCFNNPTKECEMEMEALEEEFKKDNDRYEAFAKEAREICPDAEKYIKRMN